MLDLFNEKRDNCGLVKNKRHTLKRQRTSKQISYRNRDTNVISGNLSLRKKGAIKKKNEVNFAR